MSVRSSSDFSAGATMSLVSASSAWPVPASEMNTVVACSSLLTIEGSLVSQ